MANPRFHLNQAADHLAPRVVCRHQDLAFGMVPSGSGGSSYSITLFTLQLEFALSSHRLAAPPSAAGDRRCATDLPARSARAGRAGAVRRRPLRSGCGALQGSGGETVSTDRAGDRGVPMMALNRIGGPHRRGRLRVRSTCRSEVEPIPPATARIHSCAQPVSPAIQLRRPPTASIDIASP